MDACTQCGTAWNLHDMFCNNCGAIRSKQKQKNTSKPRSVEVGNKCEYHVLRDVELRGSMNQIDRAEDCTIVGDWNTIKFASNVTIRGANNKVVQAHNVKFVGAHVDTNQVLL